MGEPKTHPEIAPQLVSSNHGDIEKFDFNSNTSGSDNPFDDAPDPEAQAGVQQADATNIVWTRASLVLAYAL